MNTQPTILFEDADLLILQKPAGVVVNRADTITAPTIQDWLDTQFLGGEPWPNDWQEQLPADFTPEYGTPEAIFAQRSGIAHRLDKDTSGVFVCAKHPGSLLSLLAQFRERTVEKTYVCLTHGLFSEKSGEVTAPIGRSSTNRKRFAVVPDGRTAQTLYKVEDSFAGLNLDALPPQVKEQIEKRTSTYQGFSLVTCWPKTGRTHQIRVHMGHLQHPLVGDVHYVGKKRSRLDVLWCPRQFLHAASITLRHPRTKASLTIQAPLTPDLQTVLTYLQ